VERITWSAQVKGEPKMSKYKVFRIIRLEQDSFVEVEAKSALAARRFVNDNPDNLDLKWNDYGDTVPAGFRITDVEEDGECIVASEDFDANGKLKVTEHDLSFGAYEIKTMTDASPLNTPTRGHFMGWVMRDPDVDVEYWTALADALVVAGKLTEEPCAECELEASKKK
jgi:hypothetical protein